jgi:ADP-ribose diphosphatase
MKVVGLHIDDDRLHGEGGFLVVRRVHLRNRYDDGGLSRPYVVDFAARPKGVDAVVVAVYHRAAGGVRVLLRDGLRPAMRLGRAGAALPETRDYLFFTELVAGIIEPEDLGEVGLRARAAAEVAEEAGFTVDPAAVILLGAGSFPTPGSMPEKYWLTAVEIADPAAQQPLEGDGSPMEEGATTRWLDLDEAIAACVAGVIEDLKTELALRRLRERLG